MTDDPPNPMHLGGSRKRNWTVEADPADTPSDDTAVLVPMGFAHDALLRRDEARKRFRDAEVERYAATHPRPLLDNEPTPQTKARLRPSSILRLYKTGKLGREEFKAAEEIRDVWVALTGSMFPMTAYDRDAARGSGFGPRFGPAMPLDLFQAYLRRYRPWMSRIGGLRIPNRGGSPAATIGQLAIDVVVDGQTLRGFERAHGLRSGRATNILLQALASYAVLAGWLMVPKPEPAVLPGERAGYVTSPSKRESASYGRLTFTWFTDWRKMEVTFPDDTVREYAIVTPLKVGQASLAPLALRDVVDRHFQDLIDAFGPRSAGSAAAAHETTATKA